MTFGAWRHGRAPFFFLNIRALEVVMKYGDPVWVKFRGRDKVAGVVIEVKGRKVRVQVRGEHYDVPKRSVTPYCVE